MRVSVTRAGGVFVLHHPSNLGVTTMPLNSSVALYQSVSRSLSQSVSIIPCNRHCHLIYEAFRSSAGCKPVHVCALHPTQVL